MSDSGLPPVRRLYERVEAERNKRGWSASELHERSGVDRATVYRWQQAKRAPLAETVNALADAFGIPREELLAVAGLMVERPMDRPMERAFQNAITEGQPVVSIGVEGDAETEALLSRLSPRRRAMLEQFRESERQRLARIVEGAAREAEEANARFADLVRIEADETGKSET